MKPKHPQDTKEEAARFLTIACPFCKAPEGEKCKDARDGKPRRSHIARRERAA